MSSMVGIFFLQLGLIYLNVLIIFLFFKNDLFIAITVIDFCLVRHLVCDQDTNYQSLRLTWASKTNCNQRRGTNRTHLTFKICASFILCALLFLFFISGRAGRVLKGNCYRLVTKEFWRNEIPDHMIPDMLVRKCRQIFLFPIFLFF